MNPEPTRSDEGEQLFPELDRLGGAEVQRRLDGDGFGPDQVPFAREWLLRRVEDHARATEERRGDD